MGQGTDQRGEAGELRRVPVALGLNLGQYAFNVLDAASIAPLVEGTHRLSARRYLSGNRSLADVLPDGFVIDRSCPFVHIESFYCRSQDDQSAMLVDVAGGGTVVFVTAASEALLEEHLRRLESIEQVMRRRRQRHLWFWRLGAKGEVRSVVRPL